MENNKSVEKNMNIPANEDQQKHVEQTPVDQPLVEQIKEDTVPPVSEPLPQELPPKTPTEAPQVSEDISAVDMEKIVPDLHPVHKTRMVLLLVITLILGLVSIVSLLFALKTKGSNDLTFKLFEKGPETVIEVEMEKEMVVEKEPGEFDPVDVVNDLDNLDLEGIEKNYLDSGLN
ncbi:hypothetical protein ACFLZK_00420 [Patescibacteria group bacterium]